MLIDFYTVITMSVPPSFIKELLPDSRMAVGAVKVASGVGSTHVPCNDVLEGHLLLATI
jgi:hypothetical protein